MNQFMMHFYSMVLGAKAEDVTSKLSSMSEVEKAYYEKQDSAQHNKHRMKQLGWGALAAGGVCIQSVIGIPVGLLIIGLTVFASTILLIAGFTIRDKQAYYIFKKENKSELAIVTKAYAYGSLVKDLEGVLSRLEKNGRKGERYQLLRAILESIKEYSPENFTEDIKLDAILAVRYVEKVWQLCLLFSEELSKGGVSIMDIIGEDNPNIDKIKGIISSLTADQQSYLIEGYFTADSLLSQKSGLPEEALKSLESLIKYREDTTVGTLRNLAKLIFIDEEALSVDSTYMNKVVDNIRENAQTFLQSEKELTAGQERIQFLVKVDSYEDRLAAIRNKMIERVFFLVDKEEIANDEIMMRDYLYEQIVESNELSRRIEELKVMPGAGVKFLDEKVRSYESIEYKDQVPEQFKKEAIKNSNQKAVYANQKNAIETFINHTRQSRQIPANVEKLFKGLEKAYAEIDGQACQKVLRGADMYEGFVLNNWAGVHVREKYIPEINEKWQELCDATKALNTESNLAAAHFTRAIDAFLDVFAYMKHNEVAPGAKLFTVHKAEIKSGIRDELTRVLENIVEAQKPQQKESVTVVPKYDDSFFKQLKADLNYGLRERGSKLDHDHLEITKKLDKTVAHQDIQGLAQGAKKENSAVNKNGIERRNRLQ